MAASAIEMTIEPRERAVGNGTVHRLLPFRLRRMVGPFIFADHMGPEELAPGHGIDVDAHPHIGLSTLSYLFEGRIVHRDSTGAIQTIDAGAVNWMTAGRGVTHTERSIDADRATARPLHGLQTWVALPTGAEDVEPTFEHHGAETIPHDDRDGAAIRLVAGSGWGSTSPVGVSSPLVLAEVAVRDGASVTIEAEHRERGVIALGGTLTLGPSELATGHLVVIEPGTQPDLRGDGVAMVLGGEPVGARRIWWNFAHSDPDRIEDAKRQWTDQSFPRVPGDHDPWVPLPESSY